MLVVTTDELYTPMKTHYRLTITAFMCICIFACTSLSDQMGKIARFIDGQDRVEMEGSTAEVSDLVVKEALTLKAAIPKIQAPEANIPKTENAITQKPVAPPPVKIAKVLPAPKARVAPKKVTQVPVKRAATAPYRTLSGQIVINLNESKQSENGNDKPSTDTSIVRLVPLASKNVSTGNSGAAKQHAVDMRDKSYQPGYLISQVNDTVVFTNSDTIRHNVFSRSGKNAFDLGTFAGGKKRGVTFKEPGIVKVYCNIHPGMATFVSVVEQGLSSVTDQKGAFSFDKVPAGSYTIEAWNLRGSVSAEIDLTEAADHQIDLIIDVEDPEFAGHKNKLGETYSAKPALFEDEFY